MRWAFIIICLFGSLLAWGADGECRLFYAGNFPVASPEQRTQIAAQLTALQQKSKADNVPCCLLLPGMIFAPELEKHAGDMTALAFAASLKPAAIVLTPNELKNGLDYLKFRLPGALPWVSANAAPKGMPVAVSRIVAVGPLRVGVIGLTLTPGELPDKALRDAMTRQVKTLRPQCDILVMLGNFDAIQAPILSTLYPETDIMLGSNGERVPQAPGHTVIAPADEQAPYLGELELAVREGHLAAWRGWMKPMTSSSE